MHAYCQATLGPDYSSFSTNSDMREPLSPFANMTVKYDITANMTVKYDILPCILKPFTNLFHIFLEQFISILASLFIPSFLQLAHFSKEFVASAEPLTHFSFIKIATPASKALRSCSLEVTVAS